MSSTIPLKREDAIFGVFFMQKMVNFGNIDEFIGCVMAIDKGL